MDKKTLLKLRKKLDKIDRKTVQLFSKRFKITEQVGEYKSKNNLPIQDIEREKKQDEKIRQLAQEYGLDPEFASRMLRLTIDQVLKRHQEIKSKAQNPNDKLS